MMRLNASNDFSDIIIYLRVLILKLRIFQSDCSSESLRKDLLALRRDIDTLGDDEMMPAEHEKRDGLVKFRA